MRLDGDCNLIHSLLFSKRALDGAFQEHLLQNMLEDKIPRKIQRRKDSKLVF